MAQVQVLCYLIDHCIYILVYWQTLFLNKILILIKSIRLKTIKETTLFLVTETLFIIHTIGTTVQDKYF